MLKKTILITFLSTLFLNSYALEYGGLNKDVFKKRELDNHKEEYTKKSKLIEDAEIMTLEQLESKYSKEDVDYIKRINEIYENKEIKNKKNLEPIDKLKGIQ